MFWYSHVFLHFPTRSRTIQRIPQNSTYSITFHHYPSYTTTSRHYNTFNHFPALSTIFDIPTHCTTFQHFSPRSRTIRRIPQNPSHLTSFLQFPHYPLRSKIFRQSKICKSFHSIPKHSTTINHISKHSNAFHHFPALWLFATHHSPARQYKIVEYGMKLE